MESDLEERLQMKTPKTQRERSATEITIAKQTKKAMVLKGSIFFTRRETRRAREAEGRRVEGESEFHLQHYPGKGKKRRQPGMSQDVTCRSKKGRPRGGKGEWIKHPRCKITKLARVEGFHK